jgi:hypothetical protein
MLQKEDYDCSAKAECLGISTTFWPPARRAHASESLRLGENNSGFCGHPRWEATWNNGLRLVEPKPTPRREYRNDGILGMKSGKRNILQEMLNLFFLMMLARHLFSGFSAKILHQNKKINEIICVLKTGFFKPIIPRFQHSNIPIVSEANSPVSLRAKCLDDL